MWITSKRSHVVGEAECMVRAPEPLPNALPWRVFSSAEAMRAGVPVGRLRRRDLVALRRGLYARADLDITEADIAAALCRNDPSLVIVGLSAARMLKIPLSWHHQDWKTGMPVHVSSPRRYRGSSDLIRWHSCTFGSGDVEMYKQNGFLPSYRSPLRMPRRARVWWQLATVLDLTQLVIVGDHLVRNPYEWAEGRTTPWSTVDELATECGGRNASKLREALAQIRIGADSPMETRMRLAFIAAGIPEPEINVPLMGSDGSRFHAPDFQWPQWRVCVEYDGRTHSDTDQIPRDIDRGIAAASAGFHELRLARDDAANGCARAVRRVREALAQRGWRA